MASKQQIQQQVMELWAKTYAQFEQLAKTLKVEQVVDRLRSDHARLMAERDRLIQKLGEQTYRMIEKGALSAPKPLKDTAERVRKVAERLLVQQQASSTRAKKAKKKAGTKKKATRKKAAGKSAKSKSSS